MMLKKLKHVLRHNTLTSLVTCSNTKAATLVYRYSEKEDGSIHNIKLSTWITDSKLGNTSFQMEMNPLFSLMGSGEVDGKLQTQQW
jgi:hypothetical protein